VAVLRLFLLFYSSKVPAVSCFYDFQVFLGEGGLVVLVLLQSDIGEDVGGISAVDAEVGQKGKKTPSGILYSGIGDFVDSCLGCL
jgi:hypothetical protein